MLVKAHIREYHEDFGWLHEDVGILHNDRVAFLSRGSVPLSDNLQDSLSPVKHLHWLWLHRDAHIKCKTATTRSEQITGLQSYMGLRTNEGLYFPYPGGSDVCFHQGSVKFPLDIIFLRDDEIVHFVENTKVGSKDLWSCKDCDGVIEVNAGFIEKNGVDLGDELTFFANSERDLADFQQEQLEVAAERSRDLLFGAIANELA